MHANFAKVICEERRVSAGFQGFAGARAWIFNKAGCEKNVAAVAQKTRVVLAPEGEIMGGFL